MDPSALKPHVHRMYLQILQIAREILPTRNEDISLINLNVDIKKKIRENKGEGEEVVVLVNPDSFEGKPHKIGILTMEKEVEYYFKLYVPNNNTPKATVMVLWQTWQWYGTFAHVSQSLGDFFREHLEKDPAAPMTCSICLEENDLLKTEYVFKCSHRFCTDCIPKLQMDNPCPLCRSDRLK